MDKWQLCDLVVFAGYGDTSREVEREYQNALKTGTAGLATTEDMQKFTLKEDSSTMQGTRLKIRLFMPTHVTMLHVYSDSHFSSFH